MGSVGTRCWVVLMLGRDASDPLFLQVKEAEASVLSRFVGTSSHRNQGQRVVAGQRLMQATSDLFLGWQHTDAGLLDNRPRDFYIRQLRDWKFSAESTSCSLKTCAGTARCAAGRSPEPMPARVTGSPSPPTWAARTSSTRRSPEFACAYADQNERDHQSLVDAVAAGRITAERGV